MLFIDQMEKFSLRWNDFQLNAAKSFNSLRNDTEFLDVTLVSDDGQFVSAHKVVLSGSSQFFKVCLKKTPHLNAMIYLPGIDFKVLTAILDYIYQGEAQLYQEEIDTFLDTASKLKIDGLIPHMEKETKLKEEKLDDSNSLLAEESVNCVENVDLASKNLTESFMETRDEDTSNQINYDDLIVKCDEGFKCIQCGKVYSTKTNVNAKANIKLHVEIHVEGLSYQCKLCPKIFRTRNAENTHRSRYHRN